MSQEEGQGDGGNDTAGNPFASFAFGGGSAKLASTFQPPLGVKRIKYSGAASTSTQSHPADGCKPPKKAKKAGDKSCKADRVDFGELSAEELRQLRTRWRGMADRDAPEEVQRFQVLVGAVLSSRAQATVVDEALSRLRERGGGLTAAAMSDMAQEELADLLRHVHYNKAKAKHIRESAAIIARQHRGIVPRCRGDLLALPGVGPALVEILLNVFDSWDVDDAARKSAGDALAGGGNSGGEDGQTACGAAAAASGDREGGEGGSAPTLAASDAAAGVGVDRAPEGSRGRETQTEEGEREIIRIQDSDDDDGGTAADKGHSSRPSPTAAAPAPVL